MKYIKYSILFCMTLLLSCQQPDKDVITSDNILRGIQLFVPGIDNAIIPETPGPYQDENIEIVFEGDPQMDLSAVKLILTVPNSATVEPALSGYTVDLSKPYSFDVKGYDGNIKKYTLTTKIIPTVFKVRELYKKGASEMQFQHYANRAVAISGDHFVVHSTSGVFNYYKLANGSRVGQLSMDGIDWASLAAPSTATCAYIASDEKGRVFASNMTNGTGGTMKIYYWDDVNAKPKPLLTWTNTEQGSTGLKFYVKGDISELAYIYFPIPATKSFARWEVKNGAVTSTNPEIVRVNITEHWDNNANVVPIEVGKEANYFTITNESTSGLHKTAYVAGKSNTLIYKANVDTWLGFSSGFDYIDFMGIKFVFQTEMNAWNWMAYYIKASALIKNPSAVTDLTPYFVGRDWGSWTGVEMGDNPNVTSDVEARMYSDGQKAYIVYLVTNAVVIVRELTV